MKLTDKFLSLNGVLEKNPPLPEQSGRNERKKKWTKTCRGFTLKRKIRRTRGG